jgi:hypothetical protein
VDEDGEGKLAYRIQNKQGHFCYRSERIKKKEEEGRKNGKQKKTNKKIKIDTNWREPCIFRYGNAYVYIKENCVSVYVMVSVYFA